VQQLSQSISQHDLVGVFSLNYLVLPRFFADIFLTPLEATRIRLVSQRGYATGLVTGFTRLAREGGLRVLYAGFIPILFKSVSSVLPSS
jgi:solute carrier family 25 phosphate transporter 3